MTPRPTRLVLAVAAVAAALSGPVVLAGPDQASTSPRAPSDVAAEVDRLMAATWKEAKIEPVGPASDAEFLRRLWLDVAGVIPDEDVVRAFLASDAPDKRRVAIREALQSDGFARSMALRWSYLLVGREYLFRTLQYSQLERAAERMRDMRGSMEGGMRPGDMEPANEYDGPAPPLVEWLEGRLRENAPWDQVTREILTADGAADENPATHWALRYVRDGKAEELAGSAVRVFQGLQIQCAQCHDHPYTAWTQQDFYGVAAFFSRTAARRLPAPEGSKMRKGPFQVYDRNGGQLRIPAPPGETGRMVLPRFLTGEVIRPGGDVDRRAEVARLMTAPTNPYFAKAMVNRVWSFFFGRGIISPVDDLETQEYPHPAALDLLVRDFKQSGHDMRRLCEVILSTRAYQLSSGGPTSSHGGAPEQDASGPRGAGRDAPAGGSIDPARPASVLQRTHHTDDDDLREAQLQLFARAPLRSLSAEQLFYSVLSATGAEDVRTSDRRARARLERRKLAMLRKFIQTFGDDEGEEVVEEGTIPQALLLLNGPLTNDAIRPRADHPVYERLFRMKSHDERIETMYLRVLGRMPTADERGALRELLSSEDARAAAAQAQAYADIYWALLNSSEFAFNH